MLFPALGAIFLLYPLTEGGMHMPISASPNYLPSGLLRLEGAPWGNQAVGSQTAINEDAEKVNCASGNCPQVMLLGLPYFLLTLQEPSAQIPIISMRFQQASNKECFLLMMTRVGFHGLYWPIYSLVYQFWHSLKGRVNIKKDTDLLMVLFLGFF